MADNIIKRFLSSPSPLMGEGWGEGEDIGHSPSPSPLPEGERVRERADPTFFAGAVGALEALVEGYSRNNVPVQYVMDLLKSSSSANDVLPKLITPGSVLVIAAYLATDFMVRDMIDQAKWAEFWRAWAIENSYDDYLTLLYGCLGQGTARDSCVINIAEAHSQLIKSPKAKDDLRGAYLRRREQEREREREEKTAALMSSLGGNYEEWRAKQAERFHWQPLNVSPPLDWVSPEVAIEIREKAEELAEKGEDEVNGILENADDVILYEAASLALVLINIAEQQQKRDEGLRKANGIPTAREEKETPEPKPVHPSDNGGVTQSADTSQVTSSPQESPVASSDEKSWADRNRELFPELDIQPDMEEAEIVKRLRRFLEEFRSVERRMYDSDIHCWHSANLVTRLLVARGFDAFGLKLQHSVAHTVTAVEIGQKFYLVDINGQQFGKEHDQLFIVPEEEADSAGLGLYGKSPEDYFAKMNINELEEPFRFNDYYERLEQKIRAEMGEPAVEFQRSLEGVFEGAPRLPDFQHGLRNSTLVPERTAVFCRVMMARALEKLKRQNPAATESDVVIHVAGPGMNLVEILAWLKIGASVVVTEADDGMRRFLKERARSGARSPYLHGYGERLRIMEAGEAVPDADVVQWIHPREALSLPNQRLTFGDTITSLKSGGIYVIQYDGGFYNQWFYNTGNLPIKIVFDVNVVGGGAFFNNVFMPSPSNFGETRLIFAERKPTPPSKKRTALYVERILGFFGLKRPIFRIDVQP